jgi:hypothetical protein
MSKPRKWTPEEIERQRYRPLPGQLSLFAPNPPTVPDGDEDELEDEEGEDEDE